MAFQTGASSGSERKSKRQQLAAVAFHRVQIRIAAKSVFPLKPLVSEFLMIFLKGMEGRSRFEPVQGPPKRL